MLFPDSGETELTLQQLTSWGKKNLFCFNFSYLFTESETPQNNKFLNSLTQDIEHGL